MSWPHVTLGRVAPQRPSNLGLALQARQAGGPPTFGNWQVRDVELIRSQPHPAGSVYTTQFSAPLGAVSGPTA